MHGLCMTHTISTKDKSSHQQRKFSHRKNFRILAQSENNKLSQQMQAALTRTIYTSHRLKK